MRKLLAAWLVLPAIALAQGYPAKPVRIVVPYPAGGIVAAGWTPQATTLMFADEYARWGEVARKAGLEAK